MPILHQHILLQSHTSRCIFGANAYADKKKNNDDITSRDFQELIKRQKETTDSLQTIIQQNERSDDVVKD